MTPSTRVTLTRNLEDLKQGMKGTVVIAKEHASKDGIACPMIWTGYSINVLAVQFDEHEGPAIGRMINGKYLKVIDHVEAY